MTTWTQGYVDGLDYTFDFYRELTPALLGFAALCRGQKFVLEGRPLKYCELGCGQGFSTNLLAAANPDIEFYANDFNPAHIAGAQSLAGEAALANIRFYEHAFADFADEPSLPDGFDIIALHGVFSWISAKNRGQIMDFIFRKLKPGGLVFISYNTLPGWASALPLRRILIDRANRSSGPLQLRIEEALAFADTLLKANTGYFKNNPSVKTHFGQMQPMSCNYLAHEYFNEDWHPMYFSDVARELSAAKLSFLGSVDLLDTVESQLFSAEQQALLRAEADPIQRETLKAFVTNEQFRRDLFVKGAIPHSVRSSAGGWIDARFALSRPRDVVAAALKRRFSNQQLQEAIYEPLLNVLSGGPVTVREILSDSIVGRSLSWGQVTETLSALVGAGYLQPCLREEGQARREKSCRAFNAAVCRSAKDSETLQFLASPVTGGGVRLDRFEQLFLLAIGDDKEQPDQWAQYAWSVLAPQGQKLLKEGRALETEEENLAELVARANAFAGNLLPVCLSLRIVQ
ncbi:class I SAM-dependent methyltransferase [Agrobacterium sp. 22-214-1]